MILETITDIFTSRWILFIVVVAGFLYQIGSRNRAFFRDQGVPYLTGFPIFGSQWRILSGQENIADAMKRYYDAFPGKRFFGMYEVLNTPIYVIRDPELIKQMAIKDFDHFVNHRMHISQDSDPLLGRSMFLMRDAKWRDIRSTVSPAFTGSKMRLMLSLVSECAQRFVGHLKTEAQSEGNIGMTYDIRDLFTRFSNDAIASSAFGLDVNSLAERDNEFYQMGKKVTDFEGLKALKFYLFSTIPKAMEWLRVAFFNDKDAEFLRHLVHGTIKYREENNVVRHDMINLMMEARKGVLAQSADINLDSTDIGFATVRESVVGESKRVLKKFDDDDMVAQCMIFFLGGLNAVSLTQCFMAHELTVNPAIQQKLYDEIDEAHRQLDGKPLTYETLQSLKYLDQVVSETLRRWPIAPFNDRIVNAPYKLMQNEDGSSVQLKKGDSIIFPTYTIQMDPQYFPEPERFDPDRFSDANKHTIQPGTYLPFGVGPRNCIGTRYALMGVKTIFYHLLLNFKLEKSLKTQHPLRLKPSKSLVVLPENGFWSKLRPRQ